MEYVYTKETADEVWAKMNAEPFVRAVREKAEKLGYMVERAFRKRHGTWETVEFSACPAVGDDRYLPDVGYYEGWREEGAFKMQTSSYGMLAGDEIQKFLVAQKRGAEFTEYLTALDWSKAPLVVFEEK